MKRYFRFHKGSLAEDPRGHHVTWSIKGHDYLAEVVGVQHEYTRGMFMLVTRYFNGETGPQIAAGAVQVLMDH